MDITWDEFLAEINSLNGVDGVDTFVMGYSTLGQEIIGYHIGNYDGNQILIEAGIHAREYPSSLVVIGICRNLLNTDLNGGVYIIPLMNPDGVRLVLEGTNYLACEKQRNYVQNLNNGSDDFSQWKANIWGVDLNVNFDALWGGGSQNVFCPSPSNFVGYYPDSEREVRELIEFSYEVRPALTLSFHTKGEVIYYGFEVLSPEDIERDRLIAEEISTINGYVPILTQNSTGGYSDWISEYLGIPAFTIEVGSPTLPTPIPLSAVPDAIERNTPVIPKLLEILKTNQGGEDESDSI